MGELKFIKSPEGRFNLLKIWDSTQVNNQSVYSFSLQLLFEPSQDLTAFISEIYEQKKVALDRVSKLIKPEMFSDWRHYDFLKFNDGFNLFASTTDDSKKVFFDRKHLPAPCVYVEKGETVSELKRGNPVDEAMLFDGCKGKISFAIFAWVHKSSRVWGYRAELQNVFKTADGIKSEDINNKQTGE